MKKGEIFFLVFVLGLTACKSRYEEKFVEMESGSNGEQLAEVESGAEQENPLEEWPLKPGDGLEEYYGLLRRGAERYAEEVAGEFQPVYDSEADFPEELILRLEQALYQGTYDETAYDELSAELGGELFRLEREEWDDFFHETTYCYDVFRVELPDGECLYFMMSDNGRASYGELDLIQWIDGEPVVQNSVTVWDLGYVIRYQESLYYICQVCNLNVGKCDGIAVYSLEKESFGKSLTIYYWPQKYVWETIWSDLSGEFGEETDQYIEGIKKEITQDHYLEDGSMTDIDVFIGDEIEAEEFPGEEGRACRYYKADITNKGEMVYMRKSSMTTSRSTCSTWYLQMKFFLFDQESRETRELETMEIGGDGPGNLVQLWFKVIKGKTVMFRIYHISAFNYLLNTAIIENGEIRALRNDIFAAEQELKIVLDECIACG